MWIYTSTLRVFGYIHHYSRPLQDSCILIFKHPILSFFLNIHFWHKFAHSCFIVTLYTQVTKMYDDMLKEKENLGIKLVQGEEEKKKMTRENELLVRKISENGRVCSFSLIFHYYFTSFVCVYVCAAFIAYQKKCAMLLGEMNSRW